MKNWETSLAGGLIFISKMGGLLGLPPKVVQVTTGICVAAGLAAAKDSDVTGGTRQQ